MTVELFIDLSILGFFYTIMFGLSITLHYTFLYA